MIAIIDFGDSIQVVNGIHFNREESQLEFSTEATDKPCIINGDIFLLEIALEVLKEYIMLRTKYLSIYEVLHESKCRLKKQSQ